MVKYGGYGPLLMILAFCLWGITPLFYHYLSDGNLSELLMYRVVWSVPALVVVRLLFHNRTFYHEIFRDKPSLFLCLVTGCLMTVSWTSFVYSLTHHRILDASLGYFLNPLFTIFLGRCFLKERISLFQCVAILFGLCGLLYQIIMLRYIPILALIMGLSFSLYSLIRKFICYDVITSLTIETLWVLPVICVLFLCGGSLFNLPEHYPIWLYLMSVPVTFIPLILFTIALNNTSLVITGLAQYIEPSIQFLTATFIFGEAINTPEIICFSSVWAGITLCILESIYHMGK
ncbi:TPA: EamA family transporter RarD [Salmonella enterica subsp. enterica serovar Concord]|nr:EamA family transporter RarD [Salmonella enterica subsp. enterica serovar Concord]